MKISKKGPTGPPLSQPALRSYRLRAESVLPCNDAASAGVDGAAGAGAAAPWLVNSGISFQNQTAAPVRSHLKFLQFCYDQAPVVGVRLLKNDAVSVRMARNPDELAARLEGCKRGKIESLSVESRRRLALVAGNSPISFGSFVTATYPKDFPSDGLLVKAHFRCLLQKLRRKCGGLEYLWFLEFQQRGAPHFHAFLDFRLPEPLSEMERRNGRTKKIVRVNWAFQNWLSATWFDIVGSGDEKHLRAGAAWEVVEKPDGAARYVAKESYKTFQKAVPENYQNVGRFWGCSRGVTPPEPDFIPCSPDQMARVFPPDCFGDGGAPFPVMFGAAAAMRAAGGTLGREKKPKGAWRALVEEARSDKPLATNKIFFQD